MVVPPTPAASRVSCVLLIVRNYSARLVSTIVSMCAVMPAAALENRRLDPMGGQDISRGVRHIMTRVDHHAGEVARAVALMLLAARAQQGLSRRFVEAGCVPPFGCDASQFQGKA